MTMIWIRQLTSKSIFIPALVFLMFCGVPDVCGQYSNKKPNKYKDVSGFINITEVGAAKGLGRAAQDYTAEFALISNVFGHVIDLHYIIGLGVGMNSYNGGPMVPVYIDLRYRFRDMDFTPFFYTDGGALLDVSNTSQYGLFLNPGIGFINKINYNTAFTMSVGIYEQTVPNNSAFINFKLGIIFLSNSGDECQWPAHH